MDTGHIRNGAPAASLGPDGWSKPWSDNGGACVDAKKLPAGQVALRQSADPDSPALIFDQHEIKAFIEGVKAGQADWLLT
jgi:hypothetical protein